MERGARLLRLHVEDAAARGFWERLGYGALELCYLGKDPYAPAGRGLGCRAGTHGAD
jgi:hypothetical protein